MIVAEVPVSIACVRKMLTHTYTRPRSLKTGSSVDSYNPLVSSPDAPLEYWTNGTAFHIHVVPPPSSSWLTDPSSFSDSAAFPSTFLPTKMTASTTEATGTTSPDTNRTMSRKRLLQASNDGSTSNNKNMLVVRNSILAGSVAGIASTLLLFPADVIRTKLQASGVSSSGPHHLGMKRSTPWRVLKHTLQHGGIRALYTGLSLPLAAQAVYKSTVFCVNNITQEFLLDHKRLEQEKFGTSMHEEPVSLSYTDRFVCGFMGGAVNAAAFVTPVEFVRNQMIAQHSQRAAGEKLQHRQFQSSVDVIRYAFQQKPAGWRMLWRGIGWTVARDSIGCGCFFYSMKWTEDMLMAYLYSSSSLSTTTDYQLPRHPTFAVTMVSGGVAGLSFWVSSLPLDTIKTWIQSSPDWKVQISPSEALQRIYWESGAVAVAERLFRGWQVAYGRGIPSAAITISVYSMVYRYLQQHLT